MLKAYENIKNKLFCINFLILFFISQSIFASNLSQFFPSSSGNLTGAAAAIVCNSSTYNQIRINNTTHQMEYCSPTGDTWRVVQVNPVASVQFSFTAATNALLNSVITSSTVGTVGSGTGVISVTGDGSPEISVNGGAWSTSTSITAGQSLAVRLTSAGAPGTTRTATLSVGGVDTTWTVQTAICTPGNTTVNYTGAIVNFTQPTGCYTLVVETWGAQGGGSGSGAVTGGLGAYIKGTISTIPGTVYKVLAGGQGATGSNSGGGGGGTFVTTTTNDPIMIAGGGGGSYNTTVNGLAGQTTTSGGASTRAGGTAGGGGLGGATGSNGGAGLTGNGGASGAPIYQVPLSFVNGGSGGAASSGNAGAGGFGGGSGGEWTQCGSGGAGGGYSGGGGACSTAGGGGGSYNSGTSQTNTAGNNSGNGKVTFTYSP